MMDGWTRIHDRASVDFVINYILAVLFTHHTSVEVSSKFRQFRNPHALPKCAVPMLPSACFAWYLCTPVLSSTLALPQDFFVIIVIYSKL